MLHSRYVKTVRSSGPYSSVCAMACGCVRRAGNPADGTAACACYRGGRAVRSTNGTDTDEDGAGRHLSRGLTSALVSVPHFRYVKTGPQ